MSASITYQEFSLSFLDIWHVLKKVMFTNVLVLTMSNFWRPMKGIMYVQ